VPPKGADSATKSVVIRRGRWCCRVFSRAIMIDSLLTQFPRKYPLLPRDGTSDMSRVFRTVQIALDESHKVVGSRDAQRPVCCVQ
jgi:hypothetical protein